MFLCKHFENIIKVHINLTSVILRALFITLREVLRVLAGLQLNHICFIIDSFCSINTVSERNWISTELKWSELFCRAALHEISFSTDTFYNIKIVILQFKLLEWVGIV